MTNCKKITSTLLAILFLGFSVVAPINTKLAIAAEPSPSPSSIQGPIGLVGPQGPIGPQGSIGSIAPGPAGLVGPQSILPTPSPAASPSAASSPTAQSTSTSSPAAALAGPIGFGASADNNQTGANSLNNSSTNNQNHTNVTQNNNATAVNNINVSANTGNNTASQNTGNGNATAGNIDGQITVINITNAQANNGSTFASQLYSGNQNHDLVVGAVTGQPLSAYNTDTGSGSINRASANNNDLVRININNTSNVVNNLNVAANTGNNSANDNTGRGNVRSGNVRLVSNIVNFLNGFNPDIPVDLKVMTVAGELVGDLLFPGEAANTNTGANSQNQATVNVNHDLATTINNMAVINNTVGYSAITGHNRASDNTLGGEITSGSVNASAAIDNIANAPANMLWLVNVYGECECDLSALDPSKYILNVAPLSALADNSDTGSGSNNRATTNDNSNTDLTVNNLGSVNNNIKISAITGNNSASRNTSGGNVQSGDVTLATTIANLVNTTVQSGQRFMLGVINLMGWKGKAKVASNNPASASPSAPISQAVAALASLSSPVPPVQTSIPKPNGLVAVATVVDRTSSHTRSPLPRISPSPSTGIPSPKPTKNPINIHEHSSSSGNTQNENTVNFNTNTPAPVNSSSPTPTRGRGRVLGHFASTAYAAAKSGLVGQGNVPIYQILFVPLAIWVVFELTLLVLGGRRRTVK